MDEQAKPGLWRFGAVELDERLATIRVAGTGAELDRSSYDILLALLRHAGEVVTKDELLEAGWPGRVVSENSLAKAISRLRQALAKDGAAVRVVHGYGYRLASTVQFLAVPRESVEAVPHEAARLREGDRLPHRPGWRLGRRLGEGATGIIHLATSDGGEARAVKLATSEAGLRGLKREIALSRYIQSVRSDAPVVPVLGWNLSHAPFFLELPYHAEGSLRDWATDRGGLAAVPLDERLALAAQLCDAVAALHAMGVIHRDLKPENLYPVSDSGHSGGRVLLGDLGASDAAAAPHLAALGITMSVLDTGREPDSSRYGGSLLYIAPEVIAGEMPTQRSDVYALGVLVYQLAVGDLRRSLAPGWEADVDDALLRADIATAAAARPEHRVLDAQALGERLHTLDARRAEHARQQRQERERAQQAREFQKLRQRRRALLAASATLAVFLGLSLWQQQRTEAERNRAEQAARLAEAEAAKTRGVVEFLTRDLLAQADPYATNSGAVTLREALDRAAQSVDTRFAATPGIAAAVHGTLGAAFQGMNDFAAAVAQYEQQLRRLRQAQPEDRGAVAKAQGQLCAARHWLGDQPGAQRACERARADYLAAGLVPDWPEVFLALGETRREQYREALERLAPLLPRIRRSGDEELQTFAAWFAGIAHRRLGHVAEAERAYGEMVAIRERRSGPGMELAWALADHGAMQLQAGTIEAGLASLARAEAMFERFAGREHAQSRAPAVYRAQYALSQGRWRQARDIAAPNYAFLLESSSWQQTTIHAALAAMVAEAELDNADAAREIMAAFSEMASQGLERDFPYLREAYWTHFFQAHLALREPDRAAAYLDKLTALARSTPDASPVLAANLHCYRGALLRQQGDLDGARGQAKACLQRMAAAVPRQSALMSGPQRLLAALRVGADGIAANPARPAAP
jgi:non-specific serine/threonine protein kinase